MHPTRAVNFSTFNIKGVELHNFMGSVTRFKLDDFSVRNDLADEFFIFMIPDGVTVIEEN